MTTTVTGNIIEIFTTVAGEKNGKQWSVTKFLLVTTDNKELCIATFDASALKDGQTVAVDITIESKEYNDKYFTNINATSIYIIVPKKAKE